MVYHYFGNKEGLYREVLLNAYGQLEKMEIANQSGQQNPVDSVRGLFDTYFTFLSNNPDFVRILLWENLTEGRLIRRQGQILSKSPVLGQLASVISDGVAQGVFRPDINVPHLFINLVGLCFIYHSNRFTLSQAVDIDLADPEVISQARSHASSLLFRGICPG